MSIRRTAIFALSVARQRDEDHVSTTRGPDALSDLIAIETGKTEIDDDGVGVQHQRLLEAPDAVVRLVHLVARQFEEVAQHLPGVVVVFDDEDAPAGGACRGRRLGDGWVGGRFDPGEADRERAPASRPRARHVDAPFVEIDQALDEREPDAQAGSGPV